MAKLVTEATNAPGQCLVSQDLEGPFIDAECWAPWMDPYVYLSVRWVEEVAREQLNMVPRDEVEQELDELRGQVEQYCERVKELEGFAEAVVKVETKAMEMA